jgi:hypothetical protein
MSSMSMEFGHRNIQCESPIVIELPLELPSASFVIFDGDTCQNVRPRIAEKRRESLPLRDFPTVEVRSNGTTVDSNGAGWMDICAGDWVTVVNYWSCSA